MVDALETEDLSRYPWKGGIRRKQVVVPSPPRFSLGSSLVRWGLVSPSALPFQTMIVDSFHTQFVPDLLRHTPVTTALQTLHCNCLPASFYVPTDLFVNLCINANCLFGQC